MWFKQGFCVLFIALAISYMAELGPFQKQTIKIAQQLDEEYDYIIVGGGSAGSVVASRLSEDTDSKVVLLEAGGHYDESPLFHIPNAYFGLMHGENDWEYYTEPQVQASLGMKEQRSYWPRGKVLGGSGMLNGMQYTRGSVHDFNGWAKNGCEGWGYKDVLPYFLKSEDIHIDELKKSKHHSGGGPLAVSDGEVTPMLDIFMKAGQEMGYTISDYNNGNPGGFSRVQLNTRNGVRSTSNEFLGSTADRDNLHIATRSFATKIKIENKKAMGVYYIRNGRKYFVKARKEVIISAGAVNSPQLLMLSGIGPKDHLVEIGIPVVANLPVGQNLQDHQMVDMFSKINKPYSLTQDVLESWWSKIKYFLFGSGPISSGFCEAFAFWHFNKSERETTYPDIQVIFFSNFLGFNAFDLKESIAKEYLAENNNVHGFCSTLCLTHPQSTGTIKLRSSDPFDYPIIDPKYLTNEKDVANLVKGIRIWEQFAQMPTMRKLGVDINQMNLSICSDYEFRSDAYWECFVRHLALTVYHPSCSCKMGADSDPTAVVDPQLRVRGIGGLRVVDASIFPNITTGNTNAPVIMVAEKASDMIRGKDTVEEIKRKIKI